MSRDCCFAVVESAAIGVAVAFVGVTATTLIGRLYDKLTKRARRAVRVYGG
jgi:hypothetical protein